MVVGNQLQAERSKFVCALVPAQSVPIHWDASFFWHSYCLPSIYGQRQPHSNPADVCKSPRKYLTRRIFRGLYPAGHKTVASAFGTYNSVYQRWLEMVQNILETRHEFQSVLQSRKGSSVCLDVCLSVKKSIFD